MQHLLVQTEVDVVIEDGEVMGVLGDLTHRADEGGAFVAGRRLEA